MSDIQQLYRLQLLDSQIDTVNKRLRDIASRLTESETLLQAKSAFQTTQQVHKQAQTTLRDLDLEVKSLQDKIKNHENRLYSGKVNPKEANSLQDDIKATQSWLSGREDALLDAMVSAEEAETAYQEAETILGEAQKAWEQDQADLLQKQKSLQNELTSHQEKREAQVKFVDQQDLTIYERLRPQKGGVAVSEVDGDMCTACGVTLPSHLVQQALDAQRIFFCAECKRIIYVL